MSCISTETKEVLTVIFHTYGGLTKEIAEYDYEDCIGGALAQAQEIVSEYIEKTGEYCYCTLEHRVVPIYK